MSRACLFSDDRVYRYALDVTWNARADRTLPLMVIGLNPSTADEVQNDPTVRRCLGYAHDWGYGGLLMRNLFAIRSTDPLTLFANPVDPVGADNDAAILDGAKRAGLVLCAWGCHGRYLQRDEKACALLESFDLYCLKCNRDGSPSHPLYLKRSLLAQMWRVGYRGPSRVARLISTEERGEK